MAERVCLLHWSEPEGAERARELAAFGYTVDHESRFDPSLMRSLADSPPAAIVVDLSRSPSQGRDVALALRTRAGTRRVPLVVAGGQTLGELPDGARVRQGARGADLVLWFVRSARQLKRGLQRYAALDVPVWIIWPKQASGVDTDLTQNAVRAAGLGVGLVDYKVCAVDETWSGLLFRRRR